MNLYYCPIKVIFVPKKMNKVPSDRVLMDEEEEESLLRSAPSMTSLTSDTNTNTTTTTPTTSPSKQQTLGNFEQSNRYPSSSSPHSEDDEFSIVGIEDENITSHTNDSPLTKRFHRQQLHNAQHKFQNKQLENSLRKSIQQTPTVHRVMDCVQFMRTEVDATSRNTALDCLKSLDDFVCRSVEDVSLPSEQGLKKFKKRSPNVSSRFLEPKKESPPPKESFSPTFVTKHNVSPKYMDFMKQPRTEKTRREEVEEKMAKLHAGSKSRVQKKRTTPPKHEELKMLMESTMIDPFELQSDKGNEFDMEHSPLDEFESGPFNDTVER